MFFFAGIVSFLLKLDTVEAEMLGREDLQLDPNGSAPHMYINFTFLSCQRLLFKTSYPDNALENMTYPVDTQDAPSHGSSLVYNTYIIIFLAHIMHIFD